MSDNSRRLNSNNASSPTGNRTRSSSISNENAQTTSAPTKGKKDGASNTPDRKKSTGSVKGKKGKKKSKKAAAKKGSVDTEGNEENDEENDEENENEDSENVEYLSSTDAGMLVESSEDEDAAGEETAASILGSMLVMGKEKDEHKHSENNNDYDDFGTGAAKEGQESQDKVDDDLSKSLLNLNIRNYSVSEPSGDLDFLKDAGDDSSNPSSNLSKLRKEYEKMQRMFVQARKNEQALVKKCRDLGNFIFLSSFWFPSSSLKENIIKHDIY
jgi:hypothetical protein